MNNDVGIQVSLPELQLREMGTADSFANLLRSTRDLSNLELIALDDELEFYARTGLVGRYMTRLMLPLWIESHLRFESAEIVKVKNVQPLSLRRMSALNAESLTEALDGAA